MIHENHFTIIHPYVEVQAPGRINIIGDHTDYNEGFVLPAAIDKKTIARLKRNGLDNWARIQAIDLQDSFEFNLGRFGPLPQGWQNYIMGVVAELQNLGAVLEGFDCEFAGDVPIGSGMSSSASLECSVAYGLNELFDLGLDKFQLMEVCQKAENHFVGMQCGIMDQFASMMGKQNHVLLLDCRSLEYSYHPLDLGNYQVLLLNSNVTHELANSAYNTRRQECQKGVEVLQSKYPEISSLREVSLEMLDQTRSQMPETIFRRCQHVLTENQRVLVAVEALKQEDFAHLGRLISASHESLKNSYEVSCPEIDYLVDFALSQDYLLGSRMMGGGFGGCTINLLDTQYVPRFIEQVSQAYRDKFGQELSPYHVSIEDGASTLYKP